MKVLLRLAIGFLSVSACTAVASAAPLTLTLLPSSALVGPAGSTLGWGYRLTNTSANWVETLSLSSGLFTNGTPNSIFDFPVVAPFAAVTEAFSQTASGACPAPDCGLFEFTWDGSAPGGTVNSGVFTISSELFGTNPLIDPNAVDFGPAGDATAAYSVTATGVPEPGTLALVLTGLGVAVGVRRQLS